MPICEKDIAIVIPVYKKQLSDLEQISYHQAKKILSRYDKYVIIPDTLSFGDHDVKQITLPDECFEDVSSYSKMLMSESFYQNFSGYKYIFICQLDV